MISNVILSLSRLVQTYSAALSEADVCETRAALLCSALWSWCLCVQNADDNCYPVGREQPALAFVVEKDRITILNNECGFEENNVRAICDVGRSTKGKHKYGYIGTLIMCCCFVIYVWLSC